MQIDKDSYDYLLNESEQLTEEWYESLDKTGAGVYSSTDPLVIRTLKERNHKFHQHLCKIFIVEEQQFLKEIEDWILDVAADPQHLNTPTSMIMNEFLRVRDQYFSFLNNFIGLQEYQPSQEKIDGWRRTILDAFDMVIIRVVEEKSNQADQQINEQQKTINELSAPIIDLTDGKALLPLVGEIDTNRATSILDNTLKTCTEKSVDHLFIDLSGVYLIDTMVAQQIFQLISGLELVGVSSTISGIRPEIAHTAVQLGLDFGRVKMTTNLSKAFSLQSMQVKA